MKNNYQIGDIVQSHYRSRWYGIVVKVTKRNKELGTILTIISYCDKAGNKHRKREVKKLHEHWVSLKNDTQIEFLQEIRQRYLDNQK